MRERRERRLERLPPTAGTLYGTLYAEFDAATFDAATFDTGDAPGTSFFS